MRLILFKIITKLILKYFPEGIRPIYARDNNGIETMEVIAYQWTWKVCDKSNSRG
jgi:hypothetical protein